MRIGSTVLLKDQSCVQSYCWNSFRPLGTLQSVIDSLEEYQCDEIAIIRPVRKGDSEALFRADIDVLKNLKCMTPISFGGGIRSLQHVEALKGVPIERLIFSTAFLEKNSELLTTAKDLFGHQAIQCMLPFSKKGGEYFIFHSGISEYIPLKKLDIDFINLFANEVVLLNTDKEGEKDKFDFQVLQDLDLNTSKVVVSGGVGKNTAKEAFQKKLASVLIDNKVLHQEYSISGYKNATKMS